VPTYEYRCESCEKNFDVVQSFHDDPLTSCPTCGSPVRKVFGNVGIVFKGSGFYKNDSRSGGSGKAPAEGAAAAASGSDGSGSDGSGSDGSGPDKSGSDGSGSEGSGSDSGTPATTSAGNGAAKPSSSGPGSKSAPPSAPPVPASTSSKKSDT
jgi:putative FmdB family regulatory protein